ncbi:MAG: hypothetical protein GY710_24510 [Desulfobacteraceae bacterium]|nr:hypothetical protein [Desulfobacteraceae bacterium]
MQPTKRNIGDKIIIGIAVFLWVLGLLVAGSDSIYMPWLNAVGALVFFVVNLWLSRVLPGFEKSGSIVSSFCIGKNKGFDKAPGENRLPKKISGMSRRRILGDLNIYS